jgi:diamine N-acetyltransferase
MHSKIYIAKQLRLAICQDEDFPVVGLIDLFDFDPKNNRAGIIVIQAVENRSKSIGSEALRLLIQYAFYHLTFINCMQILALITQQVLLFTKFLSWN